MSLSLDLHWPDGYRAGLARLASPSHCADQTMRYNKLSFLAKAHEPFETTPPSPGASLRELTNPDEFRPPPLYGASLPLYFSREFHQDPSPPSHMARPDYYDFTGQPGAFNFWVDFADVFLGGGVFGNGFLQEEHLCCEIPELANAAALGYAGLSPPLVTRNPHTPEPWLGFPFPLALLNARRTINLPPGLDSTELTQKLYPDGQILLWAIKQPQPVNVLAMAAPKLETRDHEKDEPVVKDLFNTLVAAFTLARDAAKPKPAAINTGPIGAGDFKNNGYLVYVLQALAARHVGVDVVLFMYSRDSSATAEKRLDELKATLREPAVTVSAVLGKVRELQFPPWPPRSA